MILTRLFTMIFCLSLSASICAASEKPDFTPESQALLSELQTQIKGTLLAVTEIENKSGKKYS